jgi:hypothetical protein
MFLPRAGVCVSVPLRHKCAATPAVVEGIVGRMGDDLE